MHSIQIFTKVISLIFLVGLTLIGCKTTQSLNKKSKQLSGEPTYRYQSHLNEGETVVKEDYNTILTKTNLGELIYRRIYPETNFMTKYIEFADPQYLVISGRYIEWYDNGNQKTKGQCYDDLKEGEWTEYHSSNGIKKAQGYYLQDLKEGEWKHFNLTGVHTETYNYVGGICQEDYLSIDLLGNETPKSLKRKQVETLPYLARFKKLNNPDARDKATFSAIQSKVINNLNYPPLLRDLRVKGITETLLKIDKEGQVQEIKVLTGICKAFSDESLRIAQLLTDWSPATCGGLPCVGEYRLFIDFKSD